MQVMPILLVAFALWLAVTVLVLALCQAAARGDRLTEAAARSAAAQLRRPTPARRRSRRLQAL